MHSVWIFRCLRLCRRRIGKALGKCTKISAVGVYSFDGAYDIYKKVLMVLTSNV